MPADENHRTRYAEIFEHAPIARVITDRFGMVEEANRTAAALLRMSMPSLVGKPLASFVATDDRREFRQRLLELPGTRSPTSWVMWLIPRGAAPFRAEVYVVGSQNEAGLLHWAITDVTERIALEEELRLLAAELEARVQERTLEVEAERARLAAVVDQIPAGLTIIGADGKVVLANAEARRLLGKDVEVITAIPPGETGRAELARADGSAVVVDLSVAPIVAAEGAGALYLFQDVSERERHERAERQFVTNAAHQLQSPLAGILSAVEVLQAGAKDGPERDIFLGHIERESIRLARLARALLILARAQTGYEAPKDEVVAIEPLLSDLAGVLRAAPGVEVAVECPSDLAVITNRELMEQALVNVAENAAKYTLVGKIVLEGRTVGEGAELVVSDTGPGIPAEDQANVLDRFYRVEGNGADGFGLGFAIVQSALEALDGELDIESQPRSGTVVRMRLPRAVNLVEA